MFDRIMNDRETGCFSTFAFLAATVVFYIVFGLLESLLFLAAIALAWKTSVNKAAQKIETKTGLPATEEQTTSTTITTTAQESRFETTHNRHLPPNAIFILLIAIIIAAAATNGILFSRSRLGSALEFSVRSSTNAAANGVWASAITKAQTADIFYRTGKTGYAIPCYRCSTEALAQSRLDGSLEKPVFFRPGIGFEDVLPYKSGKWQLIEINGRGMLPVHPALPQGGYDQRKIWFVDPEILEPTRDNGDSPFANTAHPSIEVEQPAPVPVSATKKRVNKRKTCHCRDDGNYIFKFN